LYDPPQYTPAPLSPIFVIVNTDNNSATVELKKSVSKLDDKLSETQKQVNQNTEKVERLEEAVFPTKKTPQTIYDFDS